MLLAAGVMMVLVQDFLLYQASVVSQRFSE